MMIKNRTVVQFEILLSYEDCHSDPANQRERNPGVFETLDSCKL
jgi:hypothetical protein